MNDIKIWIPTEEETKAVTTELKRIAGVMSNAGTLGELEYFLDSHGHLCMRTKEPISTEVIMSLAKVAGVESYAPVLAHIGTDQVMIPYDDAITCMLMLDAMCDERADGDDVAALGVTSGISFERLYDRIAGMIYPADQLVCELPEEERKGLGYPVTQRRAGWDREGMEAWRKKFDEETAPCKTKEDDK
ncbi:hypothetical protein [uncultured Duncaniella sp.]|uniref:hypothetical protein n=1 Tax=uncultured Duncaniella sp. TaxID=2768039 RepID=UPI0026043143|nr:hypothetical protein [uncultured Duncaniella sp.]